ncbi:MAG: DUF922 domain-containing protein [Bacteroidota bacterium]
MIFKLIAAFLLFPAFISFSTFNDGKEIPWNASRKLAWSDFKSRPDNNSSNAALTSSKIIFNYGYGSEKGFNYTISCVFDKTSSWGKVKTDYILSHEQGHFDIAEIYARKLNKAMKEYSFNASTVTKEVPALYQKIMQDESEHQKQYDSETNYSRDKEQQAIWLEKIQRDLDRLKEYADYH